MTGSGSFPAQNSPSLSIWFLALWNKEGPSLEIVFFFSVIISSFSDLQRNRMTPERDLFCTIEWLTADYEGCLKKYPNEQFEGETHNCIVTNRNRFISEHSYFLCPIFFPVRMLEQTKLCMLKTVYWSLSKQINLFWRERNSSRKQLIAIRKENGEKNSGERRTYNSFLALVISVKLLRVCFSRFLNLLLN